MGAVVQRVGEGCDLTLHGQPSEKGIMASHLRDKPHLTGHIKPMKKKEVPVPEVEPKVEDSE